MLNPPAPYETLYTNITDDILSVTYDENDTPYSYYVKLIKALNKLQDPHTSFTPPCFQYFVYVLPFAFTVEASTSESNTTEYMVKAIQNPDFPNYTSTWITNNINLVGKQITHIENEENQLEDAMTYLSRWSREKLSISKHQHARFNYALTTAFSSRGAAMYEMPNSSMQVTYVDSHGEEKNETLLWSGYVRQQITNISELCSLREVSEFVHARSSAAGSRLRGNSELSVKSFRQEQLSSEVENWRRLRERLDPPSSPRYLTLEEAEERFRTEQLLYSTGKDIIQNKTKSLLANDNIKILIDDSDLQFISFPEIKLAYIRIRTWAPNLTSTFESRMVLGLRELIENYGCNACILDLRMNTGGDIGLAMNFHHLLFPSDYPYYGTYKMRKGEFNGQFANYTAWTGVDAETREPFRIWSDFYDRTASEYFQDSQNKEIFMANYTRRYEFQPAPNTYSAFLSHWNNYPGYTGTALFSPQRLLVLTDGVCGSSCCTVIKHIQEEHRGKILGFGFDPLSIETDQYDSGSFCGGMVQHVNWKFPRNGTDLGFTRMAVHTWNKSTTYDSDKIQNGTDLLEFRVNPVDAIIPDMFANPAIDSTLSGTVRAIVAAMPYFNNCFDWEVRDAIENCSGSSSGTRGSNEIYGHPCIDGQFDTSVCVFSRCSDGYYLNGTKDSLHHKTGECVVSPAIPVRVESTALSAEASSWSIIIMSIFAVLLVISVVFIVILWRRNWRRAAGKKQTELAGERLSEEPLNGV